MANFGASFPALWRHEVVISGKLHTPPDHDFKASGQRRIEKAPMDDREQTGYSGMFYLMLLVGILGILGFVVVAVGGGGM